MAPSTSSESSLKRLDRDRRVTCGLQLPLADGRHKGGRRRRAGAHALGGQVRAPSDVPVPPLGAFPYAVFRPADCVREKASLDSLCPSGRRPRRGLRRRPSARPRPPPRWPFERRTLASIPLSPACSEESPDRRSKRVRSVTLMRTVPRSESRRRKRRASRLTETTVPSNSRSGATPDAAPDSASLAVAVAVALTSTAARTTKIAVTFIRSPLWLLDCLRQHRRRPASNLPADG